MFGFLLLATAFLLFLAAFCWLLWTGIRKDSLGYDAVHLWEKFPPTVHRTIRSSFKT
jgi:hypothetical protein